MAESNPEIFLYTGFYDLEHFTRLYRNHTRAQIAKPAVLDFGCGCGRMTRYLNMLPEWRAFGSEINPRHVKWCRANLRNVETRLNTTAPPLPFEAESFDLVYSLSIFTHLPEHAARAWLNDLARVLKPGGILIVTTHGVPALDTILSSAEHLRMMVRPREEFVAIRERFERDPFVFLPYDTALAGRFWNRWRTIGRGGHVKDGSEYGTTFIHPNRATELWTRGGFNVLEFIPGGMRAWQDVFVLGR